MNARPVTIVNKLGLHARAATRLVNCASGFTADVRLVRGARSVNAKSIMGVLTLAAATGAELVVEAEGPDGVFLSNGPGDPEPCDYAISTIRSVLEREVPVFGICLGHQILLQAMR